MPLPERIGSLSNPKILRANITAFERLLAYNRKAKIIWAHMGWDNTGFRTTTLSRELLEKHPNLYMSIKTRKRSRPENKPINDQSEIKPEWLDMIRAFPGRFLIGSDLKYGLPREGKSGLKVLFSELPPELARKVGYKNAEDLFKLSD